MRVQSISLESFRSYPSFSLDIAGKSMVFIGKNGSGKTNILEAISLLSYGKSCLKAPSEELIRFDDFFFRVRGSIVSEQEGEADRTLEYVFQTQPKRQTACFVSDIKTPLLDFLGVLPTIIFLPEFLTLFTGSPSDRRQFLDTLLTQLRPKYAEIRVQYERILKQRNMLLRAIADGNSSVSDLDVWDDQLVAVAVRMMQERSELLSALEPLLLSYSASLGETHVDTRLHYLPSGSLDVTEMKAKLLLARNRDIAVQTTSVGPHRDDWRITTASRPIASYLSRGQQRTFFLALLFASADLFDHYRSEKPVILLDDVLSELDEDHQKALLHFFSPYQVLITTTHPLDLPEHFESMRIGE